MTQSELRNDIKESLHKLIESAKYYQKRKPQALNKRPNDGGWTVLECFEHMNRYDEFYTAQIKASLDKSPEVDSEDRVAKTGWLGGRSANSMLPHDGKMRKMKTFKDKDPMGSDVSPKAIDAFIKHQRAYLDILRDAQHKDLNKVRVKLTLPLVKFNGNDTLRFILNHNIRHMAQCKRVLEGA